MTATRQIPIDKIDVGSRLRGADPDLVDAYAGSITEREARGQRGLIQPIALEEKPKGRFLLLDGLHRLSAVQALGRDSVAAEVHPAMTPVERRLFEIDAQLLHASLTPIDKAEFLAARKTLYEEMHPETKHGAKGGRGGQKNEDGIIPFSKSAADKLGCSRSTVEKSVYIAEHLTPQAREVFERTPNALKLTEVLALARLERKLQLKVAARIADAKAPERTVAAAVAWAEGAAAPTPEARRYAQFVALWSRMGAKERRRACEHQAEEGDLPKGVRLIIERAR